MANGKFVLLNHGVHGTHGKIFRCILWLKKGNGGKAKTIPFISAVIAPSPTYWQVGRGVGRTDFYRSSGERAWKNACSRRGTANTVSILGLLPVAHIERRAHALRQVQN